MKNTYMRTFVVAVLATVSYIGLQNYSVEAITSHSAVKDDNHSKLGRQYFTMKKKMKVENKQKNHLLDWGKIVQISKKEKRNDNNKLMTKKPAPQKNQVSITEQEKDLLARLVEAEAKGESYKGKVAVATVVLNRVKSPEFPKTVTGVIKQVVGKSYAFQPVQNGQINKSASTESKKAVNEALTTKDHLNQSIYFYNPKTATDRWIRSRHIVKTIGNHVFAK